MTGFARRSTETNWGALVWELRSVNHRFLDLSLRLPDELRALEPSVRELVSARLERGKIDCTLKFQAQESIQALTVDGEAVRALLHVAKQVGAIDPAIIALHTIDVLHWPGTLKSPAVDMEGLAHAALEALGQTLDALTEMRAREGERLQQLIAQRLETMRTAITTVVDVLPQARSLYRARLEERLQEIKDKLDPMRMEQEILLFTQKSDISEEIERLTAHIAEVGRVLKQSGQVGRRLDFLMQELNREANTLAAKAVDIRITNVAVELKVLIEQMREQVQNIE